MNAVSSCPCQQNNLNKNTPSCQFVRIYDKLPECPCSCIPSINAGPPCPFKSPAPCTPSPVQCILQAGENQSGGCPLSRNEVSSTNSTFSERSQLCVFARADPINFKEWPQYQCKCVPGTCPEIAKNLIRSWGFDPMCNCPCPTAVAAAAPVIRAAETSEISVGLATSKQKFKSSPRISKSNTQSASQGASKIITGFKDNKSPGDLENGRVESSLKSPDVQASNQGLPVAEPLGVDEDGPPGSKLITEGRGFKIYEINGEKVLFNYSTKNCKWLKCECSKQPSCGCDEWARMTNYRNCCCPGAKKQRGAPAKTAILKDLRPSQDQELQPSSDERKGVSYKYYSSPEKNHVLGGNEEVPKGLTKGAGPEV